MMSKNQPGKAEFTERPAKSSEQVTPPAEQAKQLMNALRLQVNQLEKTFEYGGPSELCGALDAVDYAADEIRSLVTNKPKTSLRSTIAALTEELNQIKAVIADPAAVWANMLRGTIAKPVVIERNEQIVCEQIERISTLEQERDTAIRLNRAASEIIAEVQQERDGLSNEQQELKAKIVRLEDFISTAQDISRDANEQSKALLAERDALIGSNSDLSSTLTAMRQALEALSDNPDDWDAFDKSAFTTLRKQALSLPTCGDSDKVTDTQRLDLIQSKRLHVSWNERANGFVIQNHDQVVGNIAYHKDLRQALDNASVGPYSRAAIDSAKKGQSDE